MDIIFNKDQQKLFLEETIKEAEAALEEGNYPIGSLIVDSNGKILAKCRNENFTKDDITAHAEILCLRKLGIDKLTKDKSKDYYLFSSLEPCSGCGFFVARTNIKTIFVAALDPYRPGTSVVRHTEPFSEVFQKIDFVVCDFPDLARKSKLLMRDYFLKKDRPDAAKVYEK